VVSFEKEQLRSRAAVLMLAYAFIPEFNGLAALIRRGLENG
jgi:hypothetical protein